MIEAMLQRETLTKHVVSESGGAHIRVARTGVVYPEKATGGATQLMIAYPVDLLCPRFEKAREFGQDHTYGQGVFSSPSSIAGWIRSGRP
jgi:hypothetical protein